MPVTVLGINDGHNSGAALLQDGKVLAAVQEERVKNVKNYSGTPNGSIEAVLKASSVPPEEVDLIAIVSLNRVYAPLAEHPLRVRVFEYVSPFLHGHTFSKLYVRILHRFRNMKALNRVLNKFNLDQKETVFVEHHQAHAALANYHRPWRGDALVLTLDGSGDGLCATVNISSEGNIERVAATTYYDSPSNAFYSEITAYLGMKRWEHEYKVMGLAPYGKPEKCIAEMERIIRIDPRRPLEFQNTFGAYSTRAQVKLRKTLAGKRFDDIAAAAQLHFERLITQWVKNAIRETGISKVACAGGSFLNVKANKRIREMREVEEIFYHPTCDDGGTPVGAALEAYHLYCKREGLKAQRHPLSSLYIGREFEDEIIPILKRMNLLNKAVYVDDIEGMIARYLEEGKIVARFSGREEFGPRALGNRSILADPRDPRVVQRLNRAIKMRDFWMPFAPSILEERTDDYLVDGHPARYMIEAFDTTDLARRELPAGLHPYDLSCRPQTVEENWNPSYRRILEEYQGLTGVGGVINTSFNLHGYPIVGSPRAALHTFMNSGIDCLAIGNFLLRK
jgi:carbamoyltransferase